MPRLVLITGCSGGGKSTLLTALGALGHATVEEPGRRIVAEERAGAGTALPWVDMAAFTRRAVAMARADLRAAARGQGIVFFDRGLVDAAVALDHASGIPFRETLGARRHYDDPVFLAPPWPEIFVRDADRRHDLAAAEAEHDRIAEALAALGHDVRTLPRTDATRRVAFVLDALGETSPPRG